MKLKLSMPSEIVVECEDESDGYRKIARHFGKLADGHAREDAEFAALAVFGTETPEPVQPADVALHVEATVQE